MVSFSKLPLDMVIMIISFLTLEDAIRLCLMQKEWFQLRLWNQCSSSELGVAPILPRLDKKQNKEDHHDCVKHERKTLHHGITNGSSNLDDDLEPLWVAASQPSQPFSAQASEGSS
ncbi:hypothetical protein CTI12_AA130130 [Artemisia annua]|uniref:F-box domain-containing protein n=1 Tax=Artemisia annua TaxID=35608 RepID=A0A2U1NRI0_ARTAN|nr:hypothetical protein CTI12_AA130130 [Artemisia annua]